MDLYVERNLFMANTIFTYPQHTFVYMEKELLKDYDRSGLIVSRLRRSIIDMRVYTGFFPGNGPLFW